MLCVQVTAAGVSGVTGQSVQSRVVEACAAAADCVTIQLLKEKATTVRGWELKW